MVYDDVDIRDLAENPESFTGRQVSITGWVSHIEQGGSGCLIHLEVPVPDGFPGQSLGLVAKFGGDISHVSLGCHIVIKGRCEGIQVLTMEGCCGIVVVPLIEASVVEGPLEIERPSRV
ncbi:MAG: hypothetical protein Q7O66_07725 [Dehalococcoidia bacterium]|nr:hypothetical protein [Dehalococcoidia bacterium]